PFWQALAQSSISVLRDYLVVILSGDVTPPIPPQFQETKKRRQWLPFVRKWKGSARMNNRPMVVVQCWDDGVVTDVRLIDIFRRHGAKATFNLNAGLHEKHRQLGWIYEGREVGRLGWDEMKEVYQGFVIANHSLTHPHLEQLEREVARREIAEGREKLQQFFGQRVLGFAYPFGTYSEEIMQLVRETGHVYARTTANVDFPFPPENAMLFHPCCHFLAPDLWSRYERAKASGVFYFWGHSYEMITDSMWREFEEIIKRISADPDSCWGDVADLFDDEMCNAVTPNKPHASGG
ncbi:polysaccharide deacetylase family protein, partial [Propionivibrio sp.]|uniref:polysaccharide deacetylase family protein n=1 Tax=Propionivibrio sp. TaxID=2212460 RepID=UPI003BF38111